MECGIGHIANLRNAPLVLELVVQDRFRVRSPFVQRTHVERVGAVLLLRVHGYFVMMPGRTVRALVVVLPFLGTVFRDVLEVALPVCARVVRLVHMDSARVEVREWGVTTIRVVGLRSGQSGLHRRRLAKLRIEDDHKQHLKLHGLHDHDGW